MLTRNQFNLGSQAFLSQWKDANKLKDLNQELNLTPHRYAQLWNWESLQSANQCFGFLCSEPIDKKLFNPTQNESQCHQKDLLGASDLDEISVTDETNEELMVDIAATVSTNLEDDEHSFRHIKCVYSIIYSDTYQVPQFLFQAYRPDGTHLTLSELIRTNIFNQPEGSRSGAGLEYPLNLIENCDGQKPIITTEESLVQLPILTKITHPINHQAYWSVHPCNIHSVLNEILEESTNFQSDCSYEQRIIEGFLVLISSLINL